MRGRGRVFRQIVLGSVLSAGFLGTLFAAENGGVEAKIIGETFKALARAYVATADITQLKDGGVERIEIMREARFHKKYAEIYKVVKELPPQIRSENGITEEMTKPHAIRIVRALDKKRLYEIIDNIPDSVIAEEFHERTAKNPEGVKGEDLLLKVSKAWNALVMKMNKKTTPGK